MLQQSLEGLLIQGLQTSNIDIVRHCLRTYATIDKTRDAEALVGQVLVKPYMDEVICNLHICHYWHCCEFCKWDSSVQIQNSWTCYPSSPSECRFPFFCQVIVEQLVKSNPNGLRWCTQSCWSLCLTIVDCCERWLVEQSLGMSATKSECLLHCAIAVILHTIHFNEFTLLYAQR